MNSLSVKIVKMADKNICKKEKENKLTLCNNLYRLTLICNLSCALLRCSCRISWLKNACLSWNVSDPPENKEQMNNTKRQLQIFFSLFIFNHILQDRRKEFEVNFLQCKSSIYGKEGRKKNEFPIMDSAKWLCCRLDTIILNPWQNDIISGIHRNLSFFVERYFAMNLVDLLVDF